MKKTLFKKYFSICSSIILLSTAFLGVVLLVFASQYFKDDKYTLLSQNVTQAAGMTASTPSSKLRFVTSISLCASSLTFPTGKVQAESPWKPLI